MYEVAVKVESYMDGLQFLYYIVTETYKIARIKVRKFNKQNLIVETDNVRVTCFVITSQTDVSMLRGRSFNAAFGFGSSTPLYIKENHSCNNALEYIIKKETDGHEIRHY